MKVIVAIWRSPAALDAKQFMNLKLRFPFGSSSFSRSCLFLCQRLFYILPASILVQRCNIWLTEDLGRFRVDFGLAIAGEIKLFGDNALHQED